MISVFLAYLAFLGTEAGVGLSQLIGFGWVSRWSRPCQDQLSLGLQPWWQGAIQAVHECVRLCILRTCPFCMCTDLIGISHSPDESTRRKLPLNTQGILVNPEQDNQPTALPPLHLALSASHFCIICLLPGGEDWICLMITTTHKNTILRGIKEGNHILQTLSWLSTFPRMIFLMGTSNLPVIFLPYFSCPCTNKVSLICNTPNIPQVLEGIMSRQSNSYASKLEACIEHCSRGEDHSLWFPVQYPDSFDIHTQVSAAVDFITENSCPVLRKHWHCIVCLILWIQYQGEIVQKGC